MFIPIKVFQDIIIPITVGNYFMRCELLSALPEYKLKVLLLIFFRLKNL